MITNAEMIFDRTAQDVELALSIRRDKVQKFERLTESDLETLERGFLTINTLNRIESKTSELRHELDGRGYFGWAAESFRWSMFDFFEQLDFERIRSNVKSLVESFFVYSTTPQNIGSNYRHYQTMNDVEQTLHDIGIMIKDMDGKYRYCGEYECGG